MSPPELQPEAALLHHPHCSVFPQAQTPSFPGLPAGSAQGLKPQPPAKGKGGAELYLGGHTVSTISLTHFAPCTFSTDSPTFELEDYLVQIVFIPDEAAAVSGTLLRFQPPDSCLSRANARDHLEWANRTNFFSESIFQHLFVPTPPSIRTPNSSPPLFFFFLLLINYSLSPFSSWPAA